jgi:hypothetical protein
MTAPAQTAAEATPRVAGTITPTPTPKELAGFIAQQAAGTLPHIFSHAMDGSPIDPQSFDPTAKTTSWP